MNQKLLNFHIFDKNYDLPIKRATLNIKRF